MNSTFGGILFAVVLSIACFALAMGYGPPRYVDAEGRAPVAVQTDSADTASAPAANDAGVTRDKQPSPLIQAQD